MASFLKEQVCDFLTTGEKNNIKPVIYDCVRTHARTLPAAAQGERIGPSPRAGTDRGRFLAIHPLPPPSWLCISTARTSSRSSSPPGRARRQDSTDSTRIPCTSARTTSRVQLQSPAAMPEPMLVPESPEDPLGCVALLPGTPEVVYQDLVDDAGEGLQLRTPGRSLPPVARRR